jgi:hypothetical protein
LVGVGVFVFVGVGVFVFVFVGVAFMGLVAVAWGLVALGVFVGLRLVAVAADFVGVDCECT